MEKENMHLGAAGRVFEHTGILRSRETLAEKLLWARLSKKQLGVKFRRQHPILAYVVDFYCHEKRLAVELDGSIHLVPEQEYHDKERTNALAVYGVKIVRFNNEEVFDDIERVVEMIKSEVLQRTPQ